MQITVNGIKINRTIAEIREKTSNIDNLINQFEGVMQEIPLYWSGDDADKYIAFMQENGLSKLKKMNEIIKSYTNYLDKVPETYEILDEVFSGRHIDV